MNVSINSSLIPSVPNNPCSFYEGYYMAQQNMAAFLIKVGLLFLALDIIVMLINKGIDYYFTLKKRKSKK